MTLLPPTSYGCMVIPKSYEPTARMNTNKKDGRSLVLSYILDINVKAFVLYKSFT